jgi:ABC-type lipoprotein release transport system permease subunit
MLSAMGMRRGKIVALILNEGLVIGIVGALLGGIVGSGLSLWLEQHGFNISAAMEGLDFPMKNIIYSDWKLIHPIIGFFIGIATAVGATLIPARRIVRLKPAEALRDK